MFAVINLHTATVQTLLRFGADVNVQAGSGFTPLMLAAGSGDIGITRPCSIVAPIPELSAGRVELP